jgi:hypothetical protein
VLATLESAQRKQQTIGYGAINQLRAARPTRTRRLRDHLANLLHISAMEAGTRIATAADLAREHPALPETAAAARHGLIGPEHIRIIRDTIGKLPDTATKTDRARFDLELTGVAIAERPEVLDATPRCCWPSSTPRAMIRSPANAAAPPAANSSSALKTPTG